MLLVNYASKKALKQAAGTTLVYRETSLFGEEYKRNGSFAVAYRPTIWKHPEGKREFFAEVTVENGVITKVS